MNLVFHKSPFNIKRILLILTFPVFFIIAEKMFHYQGIVIFLIASILLSLLLLIEPIKMFIIIFSSVIVFYKFTLQGDLFLIGSAKVYLIDIFITALIVAILIKLYREGFSYISIFQSDKLFLLFFIWGIIAIFRGVLNYGFSAIGEARNYTLQMVFYYYIAFVFRKPEQIELFLKWCVRLIIVMLFVHFIDFFFLGRNEEITGRGAFRFINAVEALMVSMLLVAFLFFNSKNRLNFSKYQSFSLAALLLIIIILVQHRSVWLATIVGILYILVFKQGFSLRTVIPVMLVILTLLVISNKIGNFVGQEVGTTLENSATFISNPEQDGTGSWRLMGWEQQIKSALKNPLFGEGLGRYNKWYDGSKWIRLSVHNGYIMYFSKFGLIGLSIFVFGLKSVFSKQKNQINNNKIYLDILDILILMNAIYCIFYSFTVIFWVLIAIKNVFNYSLLINK